MKYDPQRHHRRSIRLQGYDYGQSGAYFVTLCTQDREPLFGHILEGEMHLNPYGRVAAAMWGRIPRHFPHVQLDQWVVMPNHIHGIIRIVDPPASAPGRGEAFPDRRFNPAGGTSGQSSIIDQGPNEECLAPADDASLDRRFNPAGGTSGQSSIIDQGPNEECLAPTHGASLDTGSRPVGDTRVTGEAFPRGRSNSPDDPPGRGKAFPETRFNVSGAPSRQPSIKGDVSDEECLAPTTPTPIRAPAPGSLGAIIGNFKSVTARRINRMRKTPGAPVWQRNYYEHIIRDENQMHRLRQYIMHNPARWLEDENHPARIPRR